MGITAENLADQYNISREDPDKFAIDSQGKAKKAITNFISECFNTDGSIKSKNYIKTPSKWTCSFCPFKEEQELCGAGLDFL